MTKRLPTFHEIVPISTWTYTCTVAKCGAGINTLTGSSQCDIEDCPKRLHPEPSRVAGLLADFDAAIASITQVRGKSYGHPAEDFRRIAQLSAALPQFSDPRFRHIAYMICVKLARLSETPDHLDSLVDIAGYARTWAMILDKESK